VYRPIQRSCLHFLFKFFSFHLQKAVDDFLTKQNWPADDAKHWNLAVKFLMARKFDVDRAIHLYKSHDYLRRKESLNLININDPIFLKDLETGKFTILVISSFFTLAFDLTPINFGFVNFMQPFLYDYPVCALFTVNLHVPSETTELTTLKTLIYQLDGALEK
jgi:tyrosine-protein phosphatase non-receptor type 9